VQQVNFCKGLKKVLESGRHENFESLQGMNETHNALVKIPGYTVNLDPFSITYVDKDNRFVGKTNENLDSLTALTKLEEYKALVNYCLDSTWTWVEQMGEDSTTTFFHEFKQLKAQSGQFTISLAMDIMVPKVYTVNLYIRKTRQRR
jgi:hypothetical protein